MDFETLQQNIRACRLCVDAGYAVEPPPVFSGNAESQVMIIGQAPGVTEMQNTRPFNYTSGTRLFNWLSGAGWDEAEYRAKHYMASVTRCYPGKHKSGRGDRVPTTEEQALCAPWRAAEWEHLPLKLIIPVGKLAIGLFFNAKKPLKQIIGDFKEIELNGRVVMVVPLPHPSGASTWHMQPDNQVLIEQAIGHITRIKTTYQL